MQERNSYSSQRERKEIETGFIQLKKKKKTKTKPLKLLVHRLLVLNEELFRRIPRCFLQTERRRGGGIKKEEDIFY